MNIKGFYHICMINDWQQIVREQLQLIIRSGLYDRMMSLNIGCIGTAEEQNKLKKIIAQYEKIFIKVYSNRLEDYEFITLRYLWEKSKKDNHFYGFYIHTKGVSWPNHEGGKYWRDYMNYYNICKWKDCLCKLNRGYDTCGVKFLNATDRPAYKLHYSGNFYWFKSQYTQKLKDPFSLNRADRFDAEMWIGTNNPKAASLCQMFVDYNTKGKFQIPNRMEKNIVHTLAYNLPSEVEKTTRLVYEQNNDIEFKHYICDLGFPIDKGNEIPKSFKQAEKINTEKLKNICQKYGSIYIQMPNIGVSQNWQQIINHCCLNQNDIIIGADPDERPLDKGWIRAMATTLRQPGVGMVALIMEEQAAIYKTWQFEERNIDGFRALKIKGSANWALIGFRGEFLKKMGDMPHPKTHPKYGYIESFVSQKLQELGYSWLMLPDYRVEHTDFEKGSEGSSKLLREWKNQIIHRFKQYGQIEFTKFLEMRMEGKI